jgi:nicotinamide N-methyltransferase
VGDRPVRAPAPADDVVLAAETLWDPAQHAALLRKICAVLARTPAARAHLVAGLHTGRYTLDAFFRAARAAGFVLVEATEREVLGRKKGGRLGWDVHWRPAAGEDEERERIRWIVWGVLKWGHL